MIHRSLLVVCCLINWNSLYAQDSAKQMIVFSDLGLVRHVSDLPSKYAIGILEQSRDESDQQVSQRAVAVKHAHFIVFDSSQESPRAALFRQRLTSQGAAAIDLSKHRKLLKSDDSTLSLRPIIEKLEPFFLFAGNTE